MNPSQTPGDQPTGTPPVPSDQSAAYTPDVRDDAFGFADEKQTQNYRPVEPPSPRAAAPSTQPVQLPPAQRAAVTAPTPQIPPQPVTQPAPMPADILPPQKIPAVPTLAPPKKPIESTPLFAKPPTVTPADTLASTITEAVLIPQPEKTFGSTPITHLPDDIASRITSTPMQSSSDIHKAFTDKQNRFKGILSFAGFVVAILAAAFLINQFVFQSYYVEGTSMTPTLQNNDRLIVSKVERTISNIQGKPYIPERGQIIVLDSSLVRVNGQKEQLIKRVIGLPGERLHIENGVVTIINSKYPDGIDIGQVLGLTQLQATYTDKVEDILIPENQVYVMGDNRVQGGSSDSRLFGPVDGDKIQGRLWARILPFDKAQIY